MSSHDYDVKAESVTIRAEAFTVGVVTLAVVALFCAVLYAVAAW